VATSADVELLISELSASLPRRGAFEAAARAALAAIPECQLGPGAAFRALRELQRLHFDAPSDDMRRVGARHHRSSKLADGPPIGAEDPRTGARDRHRLRAV